MDGTLTVPVIDFLEMRRRAGVPLNEDILDAINSWTDEARKAKAYAAIAEVEEEVRSELPPPHTLFFLLTLHSCPPASPLRP
jgi:hypothetical protein